MVLEEEEEDEVDVKFYGKMQLQEKENQEMVGYFL